MQRKALDSVIVSPSDGDRRARSSTNFSPFASSSSDAFGAGARIARMAWLLPQFRPLCPSDAHFWFSLRSKARDFAHLQIHCVLSPTTSIIDFEQTDKLEAHSTSSSPFFH